MSATRLWILFAIFAVVGSMDFQDEQIKEAVAAEEAIVIAARAVSELVATLPENADAPPRVRLSIPLGFKATVCQPECVFYYGKRQ